MAITPLINYRLIHHCAHERGIVRPLDGRLNHQYCDQLLFGIDPEVGAAHATPEKIADRARQWIASVVGAHRETEAETKRQFRSGSQCAKQDWSRRTA